MLRTNAKNHIKIIIVDDDKDQLFLMQHLLKKLTSSIEIDTASSPEKALGLLDKRIYDCIISDLFFPEMNGIEFAKRVKEKYYTPFIILSGLMNEETIEEALDAGVDDYIQKESSMAYLRLLLRRITNLIFIFRVNKNLKEDNHY